MASAAARDGREGGGGVGRTMQRPYAPPGATSDDDDDDIQFMVNVVPVIRIDFPCFLSRLTKKTETDRCQKQQFVSFNN